MPQSDVTCSPDAVKALCVRSVDTPAGTLTVAAAQPMVVPGDVAENLRRMKPLVASAADRGAKLVVFSECGLTGFDFAGHGIKAAISACGPEIEAVRGMADMYDVVIVTGFFERDGDATYNTSVAVTSAHEIVTQRKHRVTSNELQVGVMPDEPAHHLFSLHGLTFAMVICADAGLPDLHARLAQKGCDIILMLTAGVGDAKHGYRVAELQNPQRRASYLRDMAGVCFCADALELAIRHQIGLVSCNQLGHIDTQRFFHPGHSLIVDTNGICVAVQPGQYAFELLRPTLIVGQVHAPPHKTPR